MIDDLKKRRVLVVGVGVVFLLAVAAVVANYFLTRHNDMVVIDNIDTCAERLPGSRKDAVFRNLYSYVEKQNEVNGVETARTYHAVVRSDSCKVTEYESDSYLNYNAKFIMDIEELGYSYRVNFSWVKSGDAKHPNLDLGSVNVNCLLDDDLIYGEFGCEKNSLILTADSGGDAILALLPYFGDGYMLTPTLSSSSASGYTIILTFDPPSSVYMDGSYDTFREGRRAMMREFLKENDIDIDDYELAENFKIVK
ncbi:MAG: hypothetical protein ACK5MU_00535 [Candidatus Saccharimonadales bacterium]